MLGDTAVAVNTNDERWKPYVGKTVILPLVGREIPIIADDYADPEQGSGAVKITPAHDFNDFEVGKRHGLPAVNVLTVEAKITFSDEAFASSTSPDLQTNWRGRSCALPSRTDRSHRRRAISADSGVCRSREKRPITSSSA